MTDRLKVAFVLAVALVASGASLAFTQTPTPRPRGMSFSDGDLEKYKKMRPKTESTPLPDSGYASAYGGDDTPATPRAKRVYTRKYRPVASANPTGKEVGLEN